MKLMPEFLPSFRLALKILSLIFSFLLLFSHRGYQNCFKRDDKFYKNFKVLWQLRKIEWPPDVQFFLFYKLHYFFLSYSATLFIISMNMLVWKRKSYIHSMFKRLVQVKVIFLLLKKGIKPCYAGLVYFLTDINILYKFMQIKLIWVNLLGIQNVRDISSKL